MKREELARGVPVWFSGWGFWRAGEVLTVGRRWVHVTPINRGRGVERAILREPGELEPRDPSALGPPSRPVPERSAS